MGVLKTALMGTALAVPLMTGAAAAQDRTIDFWVAWQPGSEDEREAMNAIATFEAANPGVTVQTQVISYDALRDKLVTSIAGGDAPDITWGLIEWFGELNQMGALADLSDYAASSEAVAAFYPAVVEELSIAGELRALPNYLGLRALIYHQDMLEAAGVEVPTTWDELITTSQAIHEATGKYGFGIAGRGVRSPQELIMYLAQNGVEIATLQDDGMYRNTWADDPDQMQAAAEVFAFYRRMLDEGAIPPNAVGWGWEEEDNNFALGQYAMVVNGSWMENRIEQQPEEMADVATAAPAEGKEAATFFEIAPLYVFDNGRLDETLAFAEVLLSQEVQQALYPNRSARQDVEGDEIWGTPFTALTPIGVSFPPISLGSIPRDMEEALGRVLMAGDDPEAVAEWLSQAVNTSLRRSGQLSGS